MDDLWQRQEKIEQALYRRDLRQHSGPPQLFLYDVTSRYLEGERNELGAYGYNRDGKRGKMQIVLGLLAAIEGEPLAVRVFAGNTADPATVPDQIRKLQDAFKVEELIFVGDRGRVKSRGKQELQQRGLHYITALTDPQIRRLLSQGVLQLELFSERICEVEDRGIRYVLRKNEDTAARERHRLEDKLAHLESKIAARNRWASSIRGLSRKQNCASCKDGSRGIDWTSWTSYKSTYKKKVPACAWSRSRRPSSRAWSWQDAMR